MADEVNTPVIEPVVQAVIDAGPPADGQVPAVDEPKGPLFTDNDLNDHLTKLTHDDLKKLPAWNAHLSRLQNQNFVEKSKWEEERSNLQLELQTAQMTAWQHYFRSIPPDQRAQMIDQDPNMAMAHAAVKAWEVNKGQIAQKQQSSNVMDKLRQNLQSDDTWSTVINEEIWQDVLNTADPAAALKKLVDAGRDTLTKAEVKKLEVAAAEAKAQVQAKEPTTPTGSTASGAGPAVDSRILEDVNSSVADKKAAYKRLYGIDYEGR